MPQLPESRGRPDASSQVETNLFRPPSPCVATVDAPAPPYAFPWINVVPRATLVIGIGMALVGGKHRVGSRLSLLRPLGVAIASLLVILFL